MLHKISHEAVPINIYFLSNRDEEWKEYLLMLHKISHEAVPIKI
jgi:hypothetical protein